MTSRKKDNAPSRVDEILAPNLDLTPDRLKVLKAADLRQVEQVAETPAPDMPRRIRAINVITRTRRSEALGRILANDAEDMTLRALAAVNLSYIPSAEAEKDLIANLRAKNPAVQARVIQSLGKIGGETAFNALNKIGNVQADFVRKQLVFARTLIAYRLGMNRDPMPFVPGVERKPDTQSEVLEISLRQVGAERIKEATSHLEGGNYGVEIADEFAFEVNIGRANWMLLLNRQALEGDLVTALAERRLITGFLARRGEIVPTYAVQYVALTKPVRKAQLQIMVVRTDGEIFYTGSANLHGGIMNFAVSDVERQGTAPTYVTGQFGPNGIELDIRLPFAKRKDKRRATPISLKTASASRDK